MDRQAEARESARRHASRALHLYQGEDGTVVLRVRLEPEVGALLMQALAPAREALYQRARVADGAAGPMGVSAERRGAWLRELIVAPRPFAAGGRACHEARFV